MEIQIAVVKTPKFGSSESGDTLEFVERPNGGVSVVMADGLTSGREAKATSASIVRKVINLLGDGVRDSAAARAASDFLYTEKNGKVGAFLDILSVDLQSDTIVLTRNNSTPGYITKGEKIETISGEKAQIGLSRNVKPATREIPLEMGSTIVIFTDGLFNAGHRIGQTIDIRMMLESLLEDQEPSPQEIADTILGEAIRLDQNMAEDDMSLIVLRVVAHGKDPVRRMTVRIPFEKSNPSIYE
jgi:serine phosphatase RsbU (regulator of sigma subunit)